jgi:hypothetical protein
MKPLACLSDSWWINMQLPFEMPVCCHCQHALFSTRSLERKHFYTWHGSGTDVLLCVFFILKDCQDFHQAKDGDGWVEQSSQPFLFGLLQKVWINVLF